MGPRSPEVPEGLETMLRTSASAIVERFKAVFVSPALGEEEQPHGRADAAAAGEDGEGGGVAQAAGSLLGVAPAPEGQPRVAPHAAEQEPMGAAAAAEDLPADAPRAEVASEDEEPGREEDRGGADGPALSQEERVRQARRQAGLASAAARRALKEKRRTAGGQGGRGNKK
eukprot:g17382.t1